MHNSTEHEIHLKDVKMPTIVGILSRINTTQGFYFLWVVEISCLVELSMKKEFYGIGTRMWKK